MSEQRKYRTFTAQQKIEIVLAAVRGDRRRTTGVGERRDTGRAMSQENVEVVRKPLAVRERSSRTLDQRFVLRFPGLAASFLRLLGRLPRSSRLRQAAVWRAIRLGVEAFNRRDLDAATLGFDPNCEVHPPRQFVESGLFEACFRGPPGYRQFVSNWSEVFGADLRLEPMELIDLGDVFVVLSDVSFRAQASGVPLTQKWASVSALKNGRVIHHQQYVDHAEALEAVGLRE
jgi:ketosteroid isomerase-like protein